MSRLAKGAAIASRRAHHDVVRRVLACRDSVFLNQPQDRLFVFFGGVHGRGSLVRFVRAPPPRRSAPCGEAGERRAPTSQGVLSRPEADLAKERWDKVGGQAPRPNRPAKMRSATLQRAMGTHGKGHDRSSPLRSRTIALALAPHRPCDHEPSLLPRLAIALAITNHGSCHGRPSHSRSRTIALAMVGHRPCDHDYGALPWSAIAFAITNHRSCHGRPSPLRSRTIALATTTHGKCVGRSSHPP